MRNTLLMMGFVVAALAAAAATAQEKAAPKPRAAQPGAQPVTPPAAQPLAQPMAPPPTQPAAKPVTQPATQPAAKAPATAQPYEAEEKAIRGVVAAFTAAYNARDAKALAALFVPEAEVVDQEGNATQGQAAIEEVFAGIFAENPEGRIENVIQSIRFLGPTMAIEDGTSTVTRVPGEPAERSRYTVVHVKQQGKWLMASARDLPDEPSSADEQLKQLEWLIGEWVDESPDALVLTSYRWGDNRSCILSEFTVQIGGRPAMSGTQRIGWDPLAKTVRSWVFDSEGGFAEGVWTRQGDQWIAKTTGVTSEGKAASSTNVYTRLGKDQVSWQSRDRVVGSETVPDSDEITVARKPPKPL